MEKRYQICDSCSAMLKDYVGNQDMQIKQAIGDINMVNGEKDSFSGPEKEQRVCILNFFISLNNVKDNNNFGNQFLQYFQFFFDKFFVFLHLIWMYGHCCLCMRMKPRLQTWIDNHTFPFIIFIYNYIFFLFKYSIKHFSKNTYITMIIYCVLTSTLSAFL